MMSPWPLTPSITPPGSSVHFTSLLPSRLTHLEKSLPSKRTIAPLGGGVDSASLRSSGLAALNWSSSFHGSAAAAARGNAIASASEVWSRYMGELRWDGRSPPVATGGLWAGV